MKPFFCAEWNEVIKTPSSTRLILQSFFHKVPSHPRNVTVHEVTSSTIKISWLEPEKPNGPNLMYRIYYTSLNQTHLAMPKNDPENGMRSEAGIHYYTLKKLSKLWMLIDWKWNRADDDFPFVGPYTEYKIVVVAITTRHDGNASTPLIQRTDVAAPTPPTITNLACQKDGTILMRWKRPLLFYNTIDYYIVSYKSSKWDFYRQFQINASSDHIETEVRPNRRPREFLF